MAVIRQKQHKPVLYNVSLYCKTLKPSVVYGCACQGSFSKRLHGCTTLILTLECDQKAAARGLSCIMSQRRTRLTAPSVPLTRPINNHECVKTVIFNQSGPLLGVDDDASLESLTGWVALVIRIWVISTHDGDINNELIFTFTATGASYLQFLHTHRHLFWGIFRNMRRQRELSFRTSPLELFTCQHPEVD